MSIIGLPWLFRLPQLGRGFFDKLNFICIIYLYSYGIESLYSRNCPMENKNPALSLIIVSFLTAFAGYAWWIYVANNPWYDQAVQQVLTNEYAWEQNNAFSAQEKASQKRTHAAWDQNNYFFQPGQWSFNGKFLAKATYDEGVVSIDLWPLQLFPEDTAFEIITWWEVIERFVWNQHSFPFTFETPRVNLLIVPVSNDWSRLVAENWDPYIARADLIE